MAYTRAKRGRNARETRCGNARSFDNGIERAACSLSYVMVDDIAQVALQLGCGAKTDLKHAYRQVSVNPEGRPLLAMFWQGQVFVDTQLPFGPPLIFSAVADALETCENLGALNLGAHA